jgi:hypothetical protein
MTRLDNVSPIGRLFNLGSFLIQEYEAHILATFFHGKKLGINIVFLIIAHFSAPNRQNSLYSVVEIYYCIVTSAHPGQIGLPLKAQKLFCSSLKLPGKKLDQQRPGNEISYPSNENTNIPR